MKRQLLALLGCMALTCWMAAAADIDGKWMAEVEGAKGGKVMETLMLKSSGSKLTGSIQRRGPAREISEGMINGNNVMFKIVRPGHKGKNVTQEYKGTMAGGELKLSVSGGRGAARDILFKKK